VHAIFKELGIIRMSGKGKIRYRATDFDGGWSAVTDKINKTLMVIRSAHRHGDDATFRSAMFVKNEKQEDGSIVKKDSGFQCVGCGENEPFKLKGFMMMNTIGS